MLTSIAPLGVSDGALDAIRHALDLVLAIQRRAREGDPREGLDPVHLGLLSAALKLVSPDREVLGEASECEGLLRLLTLAEDVLREDARVRGTRFSSPDRPDIEIGDLRRRARYAQPFDPGALPSSDPSDLPMPWKEAS